MFRKNDLFLRNCVFGTFQKICNFATTLPDQTATLPDHMERHVSQRCVFAKMIFLYKNDWNLRSFWGNGGKKYHMEDVHRYGTSNLKADYFPNQPWNSVSFCSLGGPSQMSQEYLQLVTWNDFGDLEIINEDLIWFNHDMMRASNGPICLVVSKMLRSFSWRDDWEGSVVEPPETCWNHKDDLIWR